MKFLILVLLALFVLIAFEERDEPEALGMCAIIITTLLICYRSCQ